MSANPAKLSVANTAPEPLAALSVVPGYSVIEISYLRPDDLDFAGVDIWVSQTQGFDPDSTEPTATVSDNSYIVSRLTQGETYYVRLRPFDLFGKTGTNTSAEFAVTTKTGVDITGLSGWAYEIDPVDRAFIEANLADDAVPSEKIVNLTVAKLTTGTLNATETITSEGVIRAVDDINTPTVQTGIGPIPLTVNGSAVTSLMWSFNAAGVTFSIDELGNPFFKGTIAASGFTNDELSIDSDGNLDSTGTFRFGDAADNYVEYDGSELVLSVDKLGSGASNAGDLSIAIGSGSDASGDSAIALGVNSTASATGAIAIGEAVGGGLAGSIAIGFQSAVAGLGSVGIGQLAAAFEYAVVIGYDASSPAHGIAIGKNAEATSTRSVVIGRDASGGATIAADDIISIGADAFASPDSVAVGGSSDASGAQSISIGTESEAAGDFAIGIGRSIFSSGDYAINIGGFANASGRYALCLGSSTFATALNSVNIMGSVPGSSGQPPFNTVSTANEFRLGNADHDVIVPGTFSVTGTKSFRIDHPLDDEFHIFHSAVEGPGPGANIYRMSVTTVDGIGSADLPDYFSHINKDVTVMCQADEHFGRAYGTVSGSTCTLHSDADGDYYVLVMGTRCDDAANRSWKGDVRKK